MLLGHLEDVVELRGDTGLSEGLSLIAKVKKRQCKNGPNSRNSHRKRGLAREASGRAERLG